MPPSLHPSPRWGEGKGEGESNIEKSRIKIGLQTYP
jgi:hypothetical protein